MRRGRALPGVASLLFSVATVWSCSPSGPAEKSNVLLVVIDTLRADHLGCEGYGKDTSPSLDALASGGVRFANARSTSSWTLPAVASIMTGVYPAVHGAEQAESMLSDHLDTMAASFRRDGYQTAALSANPAFVTPRQGLATGFDRFDVLHGPPAERLAMGAVPEGASLRRWVVEARAEDVTTSALQWLGTLTAGKPYFLYLHYFDPHAAYTPPAELRSRFGISDSDPLVGEAQWPLLLAQDAPDGEVLATLIRLYDAEIAATDAAIGRLFAQMPAGLLADTVIAVTADHGEEFGDHGGVQHGRTLYEELIRVPLILSGPRVPRGIVVRTPVSLAGLWATISEFAGGGAPENGATEPSFEPLTRSEAAVPGPIYADLEARYARDHHRHRRALVEGSMKLLLTPEQSAELFDLSSDPHEKDDLGDSREALRARMRSQVQERDSACVRLRAAAPPDRSPLDPSQRERLKALGYMQ